MNNIQLGFVKRAMSHGFDKQQALGLLKGAKEKGAIERHREAADKTPSFLTHLSTDPKDLRKVLAGYEARLSAMEAR